MVTLQGNNFGPLGTKVAAVYQTLASPDQVTGDEGGEGGGEGGAVRTVKSPYVATACTVVGSGHTTMTCTTAVGVGRPLFWTVIVDGQNSTLPTTSYARPLIYNITNIDHQPLSDVSTRGGDTFLVHGAYFGRLGSESCIFFTCTF